jgi:hypothetical protein
MEKVLFLSKLKKRRVCYEEGSEGQNIQYKNR